MAEDDTTVKFNVGDKLFETARSLIDQHEGTMLARLVSKTWQDDSTKAVFIDRDRNMFAEVLNYLRYGSIPLPITISKEAFLRELDFYRIVPLEGTVKTCAESFACEVAERHEKYSNLEAERAKLEGEKMAIQLENDIDALACYCFIQYLGRRLEFKIQTGGDQERTELFRTAAAAHYSQENKALLQKSLSRFGLHLKALNYTAEYKKRGTIDYITFKLSLL